MCVYGLTLYLGKLPLLGQGIWWIPLPLPLRPKESIGRQGRLFVYLPGPIVPGEALYRIHRQSLNTHRGKHRSGELPVFGGGGVLCQSCWKVDVCGSLVPPRVRCAIIHRTRTPTSSPPGPQVYGSLSSWRAFLGKKEVRRRKKVATAGRSYGGSSEKFVGGFGVGVSEVAP